jgi:purine-binding chemotaxis protein CheW
MGTRGTLSIQHCLVCRISSRWCALPLEHVIETMRPLPIEGFAQAPPFVLGTAVIRGAPVPVLDGALLLTGKTQAPGRFVTLAVGSRSVALAVTEVLGTARLSIEESSPLPSLLTDAADVVSRLGVLDGQLLEVLASARIVERASMLGSNGSVS